LFGPLIGIYDISYNRDVNLGYANLLELKGDKNLAESHWNQARDLAKQIDHQIYDGLDSKANFDL
jgi:hypothetical protein